MCGSVLSCSFTAEEESHHDTSDEVNMNRFQRFQKAAEADPFAVESLKVLKPKASNTGLATDPQQTARQVEGQNDGKLGVVAGREHGATNGPQTVTGSTSTTVGGGATTFESPDWATEPRPGAFFLEVMKDGVGIDQLPLDRRATVFGRQAPLCHYVLDHPSVSRQHAALVYHKNGSFYVVDMGSAHGTFVSNERLRKDSPVEIEPGQSVTFAASTRLYMLRKAKPDAEGGGPRLRDSATPPVEMPSPPDPADTEAVVAYHTLVNRHGYDSPLNAERLPEREPPDKGPSSDERPDDGPAPDETTDGRPTKRQRMRSRVSFSDQYGGALAQVVGVSDGADVDRVGPVGVPEGQALTGKYASLVETVIEPLPKRSVASPKQPPAVSDKLKQYLSLSKGLYGDLPAPSTSEASGSSGGAPKETRRTASFEASSAAASPSAQPRDDPVFGDDDDIFENRIGAQTDGTNREASGSLSKPSRP
ncbi:hypothetical protein KFL_001200010 [Klebsormidium nitens]|uniref:FHA domain-containing protein n=1 Tax=Klebsormidium nitens TaxID=105231 RepID=A0A1Y1I1P0_KLENI|nr:hypothetical protein KFL_001200010 [Klebsormidium nitens]|eukprot:GAQ82677.1 hypothetical protein KFL_001200010 [Klebsormidium nitens]